MLKENPLRPRKIEALGWEELKALVLAYPEAECLLEEKRARWLFSRWVGLSQAERDAFRAALDAANAAQLAHAGL